MISILFLCLWILPINFWMRERLLMKVSIYVMASEPISTVYFINPSHQSVSVCVFLLSLIGNGSVMCLPLSLLDNSLHQASCVAFKTWAHTCLFSCPALAPPLCLLFKLTSWSWALLEKPQIVQLLENFPEFYGTRRFITVFTRALHCSVQVRGPLWNFVTSLFFTVRSG
jgi:hypothetical protein